MMRTLAFTSGIVALLLISTAQAQTIGYWRFESEPNPNLPFPDDQFGPDFLKDSGPNGLDLINPTVTNPTYINPAGDAGHSPNTFTPGYPSVIPQTGESNGRHAFVLNSDQFLFLDPNDALDPNGDSLLPRGSGDFTVEAMVQFGLGSINLGQTADIASQWGAGGGVNNVWRLVKNSSNTLSMGLAGNGTGFFNASGFTFTALNDYYVAAVIDIEADDLTTVDFYIQDLTAGTPLTHYAGVTGAADIPGPLHLFSAAEFRIGGSNLPADGSGGAGPTRIDEVRLSNGLLGVDDLLITLPGDFNDDGSVDGLDFLEWQRNPAVGALANWEASYGQTLISSSVSTIPEPTTGILSTLLLSLFGLWRGRRSELVRLRA